jgi:hypothetical protein
MVAFVAEVVAAVGDFRFPVGIATGPASVAVEVIPVPAASAADSPAPPPGAEDDGGVCRYTASGPVAEAAAALERSGQPGYMHLSLAAADRLGEERGLFLDLGRVAIACDAVVTLSTLSRDEKAGLGGGGEEGTAASQSAGQRRVAGGRAVQRQRSVWIDCFRPDQVLSREEDGDEEEGGGGRGGSSKITSASTSVDCDGAEVSEGVSTAESHACGGSANLPIV